MKTEIYAIYSYGAYDITFKKVFDLTILKSVNI